MLKISKNALKIQKSWFYDMRSRCLEISMFVKIMVNDENMDRHDENILLCRKCVQNRRKLV